MMTTTKLTAAEARKNVLDDRERVLWDAYLNGPAPDNVHRDVLEHMPVFMTKYVSGFQPSAEMVFLDRVIAGHYGNLCHLGCRGLFGAQLEAYVRS